MSIYTLYIKTHNKTGLKYLGFTKLNPFTYKGSGKYWSNHLRIHGNDVTTSILYQTPIKAEIKPIGLHYSKLWNIVESKEWANLKPEDGYGGSVPKHLRADTSGSKNGRYDHTEYDFYSLVTGEHVKSTPYNFCKNYSVDRLLIRSLINGTVKRLNGWQTTPVTTYKFYHSDTNTAVCMTQRLFCDTYNLRHSIITEVINGSGRRKSYKGWSVIQEQ